MEKDDEREQYGLNTKHCTRLHITKSVVTIAILAYCEKLSFLMKF